MSKLKIEILAGDEVVASWEGGEEALRLRLSVNDIPSADITISSPKLVRPIGDDFTLPLPDKNGSWDEDKKLYTDDFPERLAGDDFTMPFPLSDPGGEVRDDFTSSGMNSIDLLSLSMGIDFELPEPEDTSEYTSGKHRASLIDRLRKLDEDFDDALPLLEKSVIESMSPMEIWRFSRGQWQQSGYLRPGATAQAFSARIHLELSGSILITGLTVAQVSALHNDGREEPVDLQRGPITLPRGLAVMMRCKTEAFCIRPIEGSGGNTAKV